MQRRPLLKWLLRIPVPKGPPSYQLFSLVCFPPTLTEKLAPPNPSPPKRHKGWQSPPHSYTACHPTS